MGSSAPERRRGDEADGADAAGAPDDRVTAAVAELYGCDPQEFTDRRKALAAAAKVAGDAAASRQIGALRKPTRAAWVVNRLARADPAAPARLAGLAAALGAAEQAKDGPRLRALSAARGPLIDDMTGQALAAAGVADPPTALRDEVAATLTAALADPEVAAGFAAGTLTRAAQWAGFGLALPGPGIAPVPGTAPMPLDEGTRLLEERRRKERLAEAAAREAAEAAARHQEVFDEAERAVAAATAAATGAVALEDRLEEEVRDLEERLTRTRALLADARLRARRAEAAERRARQALDRLPRPGSP